MDGSKRPDFVSTPYDVTIIGDYNIGGDAWSSRILLEEIGLRVIAQWSGDGTIAELENTPRAKLNLIHCYRSMNYISRHMEEKYGIPYLEYNFFGPTKIAESLRAIAVLHHAVMPKATTSLWDQLGAAEALGPIGEQVVTDAGRWGQLPVGTTVTKGAILFPRLEETAD